MSYYTKTRRPGGNSRRSSGGYRSSAPRRTSNKQYINPAKFVKAARSVEAEVFIPTHTFADFPMDELLQKNIVAKGFTAPSRIQDQAIPAGLSGQDILGIADTGTGKTLAFAVPVLHKLITNKNSKVIIMAPTRELAQQIEDECKAIGRGSGIYGALLIGGTAMGRQLSDLRYNPQIVIGTPGRIKDHLERGSLKLTGFDTVVLDEVDRMLDMGFINDMRTILAKVEPIHQSFFFSATMEPRINSLIQSFMNGEPTTISVKTGDTAENVDQNVVNYRDETDRIERLHDLLINTADVKALVFHDTKWKVERLSNELVSRGFKADAIHGGKSQGQRQRALQKFKANEIRVLVATDVAARGIDVADITHVINYSTPQSYDDYVHRIGRAGRAGRQGVALTFVEA